jgi:molybdopterin-guanine dinucleotide biosynthesis protein A
MKQKPTLIVNAGGQSRRMGQPKALLPVPPDGTPLIERVIRRLRGLAAAPVIVVANEAAVTGLFVAQPDVRCVADRYPGTGTLGGIATGLRECAGWGIVVACDLPFVSVALFAGLLAIAAEHDESGGDRWDAVVPVVGGYEEPLHALYHRRCLPAIETRLARGERRVVSFMPDVRTRTVPEDELRAFDHALRSFTNANTPEEWHAVLELLRMES